jgi:peptide/nickel transport system ATP-binding protein
VAELLNVEGLKKYFPRGNKTLKAVDDVSFTVAPGETLGLVGESGSGKSTLGRSILRLIEPTAGKIYFQGKDLGAQSPEQLRLLRREMQIIFQDPLASLNPQMSIGQTIEDPLLVHGFGTASERRDKVMEILDLVGLGRRFAGAFPFEFSGGQQQRVGIARALVMNPLFVVCDEPVSALDVSIQSQIITLLTDLRKKLGLSYLFISHDLAVVKYISDKVAVMYLGQIVEIGSKTDVFSKPLHPYTKAMISSIPRIPRDGEQLKRYETLKGEIPSPIDLPSGCRFRTRCPLADKICEESEPVLKDYGSGHKAACFHI